MSPVPKSPKWQALDFQGSALERWNPPGAKSGIFQECREKAPVENESSCPPGEKEKKVKVQQSQGEGKPLKWGRG